MKEPSLKELFEQINDIETKSNQAIKQSQILISKLYNNLNNEETSKIKCVVSPHISSIYGCRILTDEEINNYIQEENMNYFLKRANEDFRKEK